jgi:hypothetical protein
MRRLIDRARKKGATPRDRAGQEGWLSLPDSGKDDPVVKPAAYLPIYEQLLFPLREQPFTLLELGVWSGASLEMWRDSFPRATIVGVDLGPPELELGDRVHVIRGDQTDGGLLQQLCGLHAPAGFDVIIDDASHLGITTARSLQILYAKCLRPGGLYCIEDWGTGYLPSWDDGGQLDSVLDVAELDVGLGVSGDAGVGPVSMPSHDIGMVGLIKRLVDHAAGGTIGFAQPEFLGEILAIESMTVWDGIVALRKPTA